MGTLFIHHGAAACGFIEVLAGDPAEDFGRHAGGCMFLADGAGMPDLAAPLGAGAPRAPKASDLEKSNRAVERQSGSTP